MEKIDSDLIFNKLVSLRREIAENAGVVPRGIISDVALRKIADNLPETEGELKKVSGISQLFVQRFAKMFLVEIEKIKLNPKEPKVSKVANDALKLLEKGLSFEDVTKRLFANNLAMASNYIVELVEAPYPLDSKMFVPGDAYDRVLSFVKSNPQMGLREIQSKIEVELDQPLLKMAVSFAKVELGITK
ncbi:MAG TPA: HRDC domain-containing protein [Candidatus Kapabacteria bacterium]|nr:HRDC domain-containing protein [Candidatus Kapabacteria bacterium]